MHAAKPVYAPAVTTIPVGALSAEYAPPSVETSYFQAVAVPVDGANQPKVICPAFSPGVAVSERGADGGVTAPAGTDVAGRPIPTSSETAAKSADARCRAMCRPVMISPRAPVAVVPANATAESSDPRATRPPVGWGPFEFPARKGELGAESGGEVARAAVDRHRSPKHPFFREIDGRRLSGRHQLSEDLGQSGV